jgi:hypothetical protein
MSRCVDWLQWWEKINFFKMQPAIGIDPGFDWNYAPHEMVNVMLSETGDVGVTTDELTESTDRQVPQIGECDWANECTSCSSQSTRPI